jgi:hypothetical protein
MRAFSTAMAALCLAFMAHAASAQQDLQPAVQTSPAAAPAPGPASASPRAPPAAASATAGTINSNGKPEDPRAGKPATAPTKAAAPAAAATAGPAGASSAAPRTGKSSDHIELDITQISGNRELPKVMYVVPWRKADPGEFTGRPLNSLLDEALTPVDRDVFKRQNRYYAALQGEPGSVRSQPGAAGDGSAAPTPKDEK